MEVPLQTSSTLPHSAINWSKQSGRGEKAKKNISYQSYHSQSVKLHESENPWKPMHKIENPEVNPDIWDREKLRRNVQGVLNKLTPQKFEVLLAQLKSYNIDDAEKLTCVIDLIFEKAVNETNFIFPYANLCKALAQLKVPCKDGTFVNFRKLLLTKCQKEFEQGNRPETDQKDKVKAIQAAAEPEKKKILQLELEEMQRKHRYRQLGNIRFTVELFKLGMIIEPIMHECIKKLLSQDDEESLECLCIMLRTIGKDLEKGKSSKGSRVNLMDVYFSQMSNIVDKRLTTSRVRFMLQDVIDLKKSNWVPRRDNNPKTIDQIHKDIEREAREQQQVFQNMSSYPKRMPDDRDRRKTSRNMGQSEDGWTPSTKSNKGSYSTIDPTKLKLTKKLEFTLCPTKLKQTPMTYEEMKKYLLNLLRKSEENEEIFDWIDANVGDLNDDFIRALVTAVHEDVITGAHPSFKLDASRLKKRAMLLTRYISGTEKLEMQALYAIQYLMNKLNHPMGLLHQIFNILYDDDVITEDAFKKWEQNDTDETEGKAVAVHSTFYFFTWLRESESGGEEDFV